MGFAAFRFYPTADAWRPRRYPVARDTYLADSNEGGNSADQARLVRLARCGNVYTFLATGRPNATGVAGSRTDRRRAVPARTGGPRSRESGNREPQRRGVRRDGGGQGSHDRAAPRTGARRPPAGPQNFWLRQKFNCATFGKSSKSTNVRVFCGRKGKRMERLSLKAEETLWLYPCQFRVAR